MSRGKSNYPVGATWKAVNSSGHYCEIWLQQREGNFETWRFSFHYADGSNSGSWHDSDWGTSYRMCYNMCAYRLFIHGEKMPRFKRIT